MSLERGSTMVIGDPGARGVYAISVAAELVGMGQQNLRLYERAGLLEPGRTEGGTRRYSDNDIVILRRIAELLALGLNLSGIRVALALEAENTALRQELSRYSDGADDAEPAAQP
ncbi:MerR family transcriptional regulator [Paeniglutamicibacter sulfureus]|uniref:DNA-binding transcriptional MerR regulator n=1 Tax=Paeniglutamicibacter sulfureus TaxID=43666 RepID=A0ABU2BFA4_9MICC|nr:MerR family transcriptional regulator [Paeniglutamicibacter sulfureus]MDR7357270.1 DNA-binding transcriptional MerR regulator [Paeniglutamicibacter sulfureus]